MKPKRYPYSGKKKQPEKQIAIEVNGLKADVASVASRTNQVFSRIVGDTKISVNNNGVELEAPIVIWWRYVEKIKSYFDWKRNDKKRTCGKSRN